MDEPKIITATEASRSFSDLLHRVCYGGESFVIKKGNRMMAKIAPVVVQESKTSAEPVEESIAENVTPEEAEYYQTVLAQLRQSALEPCE